MTQSLNNQMIQSKSAPLVCVLGATGFIGGHIARAAQAQGWRVRAGRRRDGFVGAIGDVPVDWVRADLSDINTLREAMRGCDLLFHAAAAYPQDFRHIDQAVNRARAEMGNVLQVAQALGIRRVIYTSSLTTLGPSGDERTSYRSGSLRSAYYEAKLAMEQMALQAADKIDLVALLPTAVFGPGDIKPTTSIVIREAADGHVPVYFDATLNAVDVRDVALAHIAAVTRAQRGERYAIGGHNIALRDFLNLIARCANRAAPNIQLSRNLLKRVIQIADAIPFITLPENFRAFEQWRAIDDRKARAALAYPVRPLEETVRDTIAWFREHAKRRGSSSGS